MPPAFHSKLCASHYIRHRKWKDAAAGGFEAVVGRNKHLDILKTALVVFVMVNLVFQNTFWRFVQCLFWLGPVWITSFVKSFNYVFILSLVKCPYFKVFLPLNICICSCLNRLTKRYFHILKDLDFWFMLYQPWLWCRRQPRCRVNMIQSSHVVFMECRPSHHLDWSSSLPDSKRGGGGEVLESIIEF